MNRRSGEKLRIAQVCHHPTFHEVWKGYQGRFVRCECGNAEGTHYEDWPPPTDTNTEKSS